MTEALFFTGLFLLPLGFAKRERWNTDGMDVHGFYSAMHRYLLKYCFRQDEMIHLKNIYPCTSISSVSSVFQNRAIFRDGSLAICKIIFKNAYLGP